MSKLGFVQEEGGETFTTKEHHEVREEGETPTQKIKESFQGGGEAEQKQQQGGGGIIQAIGETLVEIGQTTKDLVAEQYPVEVLERKDEEKDKKEPYKGSGEGI